MTGYLFDVRGSPLRFVFFFMRSVRRGARWHQRQKFPGFWLRSENTFRLRAHTLDAAADNLRRGLRRPQNRQSLNRASESRDVGFFAVLFAACVFPWK